MVDVARLVGVSQKTVSRVINGAPHVRPEVRARVLAAVAELDYRPNGAARALVTSRTHTIGVLAVATHMFGPAARVFSLEHAARRSGYEMALVSLPDMSPAPLRQAVRELLDRGCEGIVLELSHRNAPIDDALLRGVPVATRFGALPGVTRQAVVRSDQTEAGRLATEHLLGLGHLTVSHVAGPVDYVAAQERRDGWATALRDAGRQAPEVLPGDWSAASGYRAGRLLAARPDVTAVFTANDHQAMGVLRALTEVGRRVPDDVSVVGFDDVPEAEFQMVPLTTVRADDDAISDQVLTALVALVEGGTPAASDVDLLYQLVLRRSTGPPPSARDPGAEGRPPGAGPPAYAQPDPALTRCAEAPTDPDRSFPTAADSRRGKTPPTKAGSSTEEGKP